MIIVSSGFAGRAGRFREQRKHSVAILRIEKGLRTFFDSLKCPRTLLFNFSRGSWGAY